MFIDKLCNMCISILLQVRDNNQGSGPICLAIKIMNKAKTEIGINNALKLYERFLNKNSNNNSNNSGDINLDLKDATYFNISRLERPRIITEKFMNLNYPLNTYILLKFNLSVPEHSIYITPRALIYFFNEEMHIRKYNGEYFRIKYENVSFTKNNEPRLCDISWSNDGRWIRIVKFFVSNQTKQNNIINCSHIDIETMKVHKFEKEKQIEFPGFGKKIPKMLQFERIGNNKCQLKAVSVFGLSAKIIKVLNWKIIEINRTNTTNKLIIKTPSNKRKRLKN